MSNLLSKGYPRKSRSQETYLALYKEGGYYFYCLVIFRDGFPLLLTGGSAGAEMIGHVKLPLISEAIDQLEDQQDERD